MMSTMKPLILTSNSSPGREYHSFISEWSVCSFISLRQLDYDISAGIFGIMAFGF